MTLKGLHALVELGTGAAVLALSPGTVAHFLIDFAQREQARGWPDFAVDFLLRFAHVAQSGQHFAGIYLLIVGMMNLGLVIGLLTRRLWSYPAALAALTLLMAYQVYRYTHTHGLILLLLTLFDAGVWWVVYQEYQFLRVRMPNAAHPNAV